MAHSSKLATMSGIIASFLWSFAAPILAMAEDMNPFLYFVIMSITSCALFVSWWCLCRINPLPQLKKISLWFYVFAFFGVGGHSIMWIFALQNAPPLEAALIIYTWPFLVVIFTSISLKQHLYWYHYVACVIGFVGLVILLLGKGLDFVQFNMRSGHFYAFLCALCWSVYSAVVARYKHISVNVLSVVYLISAFVGTVLLLFFSDNIKLVPSDYYWPCLAAVTSVSGMVLWSFGLKGGNVNLVGVFSFLIPVFSTFYLVAFGFGEYSVSFVIALFFVMASIFLMRYGPKIFGKPKG